MKKLYSNNRASVFAVVAFFLMLAFFAFLWYFTYSSDGWVTRIVNAAEPIHANLGSDTHELYSSMTSFIDEIMTWILVIVVIGLFIAGLVYTQRKRAEDYY